MSDIESNLKKKLRGKKACSPGDYLKIPHWPNGRLKVGKGKILGQGEYGKVYRGTINNNGRRYTAYKEIDTKRNNLGMAAFEYKVAKKLKGYGVPDMYLYKKCEGLDILYLEYIKGGKELQEWWATKPDIIAIKSVMVQVLSNLYRIKEKYPGFRHHDLHSRNIMIRRVPVDTITVNLPGKKYQISNGGVEAIMIDFGLSSFPKISNPMIEDGSYEHVGISKKSHPLYDLHLFLNTMYTLVRSPSNGTERLVHNFIKYIIPNGYLDTENTYVTFYRIKQGLNAQHTQYLPSFGKVLSSTFFTGENKVKNIIKKVVSRPRKKVVITKPKAPAKPVDQKNAMARAIAVMKAGKVQPKKKRGPVVTKNKSQQ